MQVYYASIHGEGVVVVRARNLTHARSLLDEALFDEGILGEDLDIEIEVWPGGDQYVFIENQ